jgi:uncharacterized protein (DUF111 family)
MMAQNVIVFQPEFGVSGDMILGSLVDLLRIDIAQDSKFMTVLKKVATGYESTAEIKPRKVKYEDLQGIAMDLTWDNGPDWSRTAPAADIRNKIEEFCTELNMEFGKELALNSIDTIIEAEAKVHGQPEEKVEFHELSSPRLVVNLIGVGYIVENYIDSSWQFCSTPIHLGMGKIKIAHGEFKVPPPVTANILEKFEFKPSVHYNKGPYSGELATPSGVALLCNLVRHYFPASPIPVDKFGIGFGSRSFQSKQSYLRVLQS